MKKPFQERRREMAQITGTVRKTIFTNGDFRVYDTVPHGAVKVNGGEAMAVGQRFDAEGRFEPYKGRMTFSAAAMRRSGEPASKPAATREGDATTPAGVSAWAASIGADGVASRAATLLAGLDAAAIDSVMGDPMRLADVFGLARKRAEAIASAWTADVAKATVERLVALGVPQKAAKALTTRHGAGAVALVERDPWILTAAFGTAPARCDAIAATLGLPEDCDARVASGLRRAIEASSLAGHTGVAATTAAADTAAVMGLTLEAVSGGVARAIASHRFADGGTVDFEKAKGVALVQLPAVRDAEVRVGAFVRARAGVQAPRMDAAKAVKTAERRLGLVLDPSQRSAAATALASMVSCVTGGPGTGKTTLTRILIAALTGAGRKVLLVAPTGRAAKRLSEVTGMEACTIHRALECDPFKGTFKRDEGKPIAADVIIADEFSMVDLELADALMRATGPRTQLVIVGDVDQLPSVNAGNVLHDVIASGRIPCARLDVVHRQGENSGIVVAAHEINAGRVPEVDAFDDVDVEYLDGSEAIRDRVVALASRELPARGFTADQIMVLSPMKGKAAGVLELNRVLKAAINPARKTGSVSFGDTVYSVGDRVMHVRNDYEKEVFNGEIGKVSKVGGGRIEVVYPTTVATYGQGDIGDIVHALAATVHKAQGSEMECVILVVDSEQFNATRKLVYTAATRAKKHLVVLTQRHSLRKALARTGDAARLTGLPSILAAKA